MAPVAFPSWLERFFSSTYHAHVIEEKASLLL